MPGRFFCFVFFFVFFEELIVGNETRGISFDKYERRDTMDYTKCFVFLCLVIFRVNYNMRAPSAFLFGSSYCLVLTVLDYSFMCIHCVLILHLIYFFLVLFSLYRSDRSILLFALCMILYNPNVQSINILILTYGIYEAEVKYFFNLR